METESFGRVTNVRCVEVAEFRVAIDERLASLKDGEKVDGEEIMAKLISGLGKA
jgi:hypothetical protein